MLEWGHRVLVATPIQATRASAAAIVPLLALAHRYLMPLPDPLRIRVAMAPIAPQGSVTVIVLAVLLYATAFLAWR